LHRGADLQRGKAATKRKTNFLPLICADESLQNSFAAWHESDG
jgi:hypothetical protein